MLLLLLHKQEQSIAMPSDAATAHLKIAKPCTSWSTEDKAEPLPVLSIVRLPSLISLPNTLLLSHFYFITKICQRNPKSSRFNAFYESETLP